MSLRTKEKQIRKDSILGITVSQYIQSVTPVSSKYIANQSRLDLSSASIRNILAELEDEGYLTHPHTSAGRIPTQKGYRYYVDNLMEEIQLLEDEKHRIKAEYEHQVNELEFLLEKTSQMISYTTQYTSIISVDGFKDKLYCRGTNHIVEYPDYQELGKIKSILLALEEKEKLWDIINRDLQNKVDILIGHEIACSEINGCSLAISRYTTKAGPSGRIAILGPTRMDYERVVSTLDYFSDLIEEIF